MSRVRISRLVVGIELFCVLVAPAYARRGGAPAGANGSTASGGFSCQVCHGTTAGAGSVQILGMPSAIVPSQSYDLIVRISDATATQVGAGFEFSAENAAGSHVGTITLPDVANTQFTGSWVTHTGTGVNNSVTNWIGMGRSADYTVRWTAPATDIGPVDFWAAGNAINNNNLQSGDRVYLTRVTRPFLQTGACCIDAIGQCAEDMAQVDCSGIGGRYGGDNSTCGTISPVCTVPPPLPIHLQPIATGLAAPLHVTHAGDGSGRLFIVDQSGLIRVVDPGGNLLPAPFLDIRDRMIPLGTFYDERGLLGMAFHPDYVTNGRFFVRYSAPRASTGTEPCDLSGFNPGCHKEVLSEFHPMGLDPTSNVADPGSEIVLLTVDEPQFNHNAGAIEFGPDGYLYVPLGDGGGADDGLSDSPPSHGPIGHGQDTESLLGDVLRIGVDGDDFPLDPDRNYTIPPDNPFVGGSGADEIYAYGFRNPYRLSFDDGPGGNGALYVADVGQDLFEELDVVVSGGNYGWAVREGMHCFDPFGTLNPPATCAGTGMIDPILEYLHPRPCTIDAQCSSLGVTCDLSRNLCDNEGGLSIIGGYVYRGAGYPALEGNYVFGDFSSDFFVPAGRLYFVNPFIDGPFEPLRREFVITSDGQPLGEFLKGFGRDQSDELYVCTSIDLAPSGTSGTVYRIVGPPATPLPEPEPPGCGPMPCLPETKQRYISFGLDMVDAGKDTGLRVKMTSLHHPAAPVPPGTPSFAGFEGQFRYVNLLGTGTCPDSAVRGTSVRCGVLSCTPEYRDWTTFLDGRTLHVTGAEIVPDSTYGVAHLAAACAGSEATCAAASTELPVKTARWGNVDGSGTNAASDVNVTDIATVVNKVKDLVSGTVIKPRAQVQPEVPNPMANVNVLDIANAVDALKFKAYPFGMSNCP
ncbi:MAG: PQQ-dependent sugar dehydrogenase [Planctomycetota bacterium]